MKTYHALPEGHPQHHLAASLEHRVSEAVERARKVWGPDSRRAYETFTDLDDKQLIRVQHVMIALEVCVGPSTWQAESRVYRTTPDSLCDLFEAAWVKAQVDHDPSRSGVIWRERPAVKVMDLPNHSQLWSLCLRVGFVPEHADRLIDGAEEQKIKYGPMLAELGVTT